MRVCIVGLGLMGGSTALVLRERYPGVHIAGVDQSREHAAYALSYGMVDKILPLDLGVPEADLVVLAAPVNSNVKLLASVLDRLDRRAVVMDMGSTKVSICEQADKHPKRGRFVACHPIAGTERSGPEAAFSELLPDKPLVLCDVTNSEYDATERVTDIFSRRIGMSVSHMSAVAHDYHAAYVSHLSHVSAFALGATVLGAGESGASASVQSHMASVEVMADSGFASTTRLAKSSPAVWASIFSQNQANLSQALGDYIANLTNFKEMLDRHDELESYQWIQRANEVRRGLSGKPSVD